MNSTTALEYLPAILLLVSVMTIIVLILTKFGAKLFDKEYKPKNLLLVLGIFLFLTILIVHLFKEQAWTSDILKVLIGVLLGASSIKLKKNKSNNNNSSIDISGGDVVGDIAGRDINKNIQNIQDAILKIEDSIVHQNNQIHQFTKENYENDFLINTIYERGESIRESISKVTQHWHDRGWRLKHFSSDYQGMDGIFLVFTKVSTNTNMSTKPTPKIYYYNGTNLDDFKKI